MSSWEIPLKQSQQIYAMIFHGGFQKHVVALLLGLLRLGKNTLWEPIEMPLLFSKAREPRTDPGILKVLTADLNKNIDSLFEDLANKGVSVPHPMCFMVTKLFFCLSAAASVAS